VGVAPPASEAVLEQTLAANHRSLIRYRVMAYVTGTLLVILVFVGIPLQVTGVTTTVVKIVGTGHGFLYLVYLATAFDLSVRLRVPIFRMILVLLAGTVPFAAFYAERRLTHFCEESELRARHGGGDADVGTASPTSPTRP